MPTKTKKRIWIPTGIALLLLLLLVGFLPNLVHSPTPEELSVRQTVVETARGYLGCQESDGSHRGIIDTYNTLPSLPRGYAVTYEDSWCATFVSTVIMECGLADQIPVECSCQQMIDLYQELDRWEENDWYIPQVGDVIFYAWDESPLGDNTGWADHVGIVTGVYGPILQVIEGNKDDAVGYRYIPIGHPDIRGYGLPDYTSLIP